MALDLSSGRYVFFKSLGYQNNAYKNAIQDLSTIKTELMLDNSFESESEKHLSNIQKYLNFISSMIKSLHSNEIDFLEQQLKQLPEDSELRKLFPENGDLSNFDYAQLNAAFNAILQNKDQYEQSLKIQRENMATIKDSYLHAAENKDTKQRLDDAFEHEYLVYVRQLMREAYKFNAARMKGYQKSLTRQLAARANAVLQNISSNKDIIGAIEASISATGDLNMSDAAIQAAIVNVITDRVINTPLDTNIEDITNGITNDLVNKTKDTLSQMEKMEFSRILQPDFQELETLALTTNKSLGEHILNLSDKSIENIKDNYPEVSKDIDTLIKQASKKKIDQAAVTKLKSRITRDLRQQIKLRAQAMTGDMDKLERMTKEAFNSKFRDVSNFITPTAFSGNLAKSLAHVKFEHQTIAEILASNDVQERIANAIANNIPGISVSFKADIRFSVGVISDNIFDNIDLMPAINDVIAEQYPNFLLKYKEKSGGQTNVEDAMAAYREWLSQMKEGIDEMITLNESITGKVVDRNKVYEAIHNSFSTSISVKDYDVYNDILGFHGGSLGGKKSSEQVLKNITDMYQLGGITNLDVDALMFAAMNCGDAMIGGSDLREQLENFLVGGAALLMFDDSFAAAEGFFQNVANEFKGQKIVNIYRLNTEYKTASYVLQGIYDQLLTYYQDLQEQASPQAISMMGKVTITNNVTPDDIPKTGSPQERWEAVSKYTQQNIKISFSFMGGLLDTLSNPPALKP